jgi:hypothetical protein
MQEKKVEEEKEVQEEGEDMEKGGLSTCARSATRVSSPRPRRA